MDIMASIAETLLDLHAQLTKKYDFDKDERFWDMFFAAEEEDHQHLLRLCEADLSSGAMVLIGLCHQCGKGTPTDRAQAVEWYKRSADLGNHMAMKELGELYDGEDDSLSVTWSRRSAELGNPIVMRQLGEWYQGGHDDRQAFEWFKRSAELGNPVAMDDLALCYKYGRGVDKDINLAITWFQKSIDTDPKDLMDSQSELDKLLREMEDPRAYLRYYCRLYESCDAKDKNHYEGKILEGGADLREERLDITLRWYHLEEQVKALTAKIEALGAENETLRTELAYQPGGTGYQEAMTDFVNKASLDGSDARTLGL